MSFMAFSFFVVNNRYVLCNKRRGSSITSSALLPTIYNLMKSLLEIRMNWFDMLLLNEY